MWRWYKGGFTPRSTQPSRVVYWDSIPVPILPRWSWHFVVGQYSKRPPRNLVFQLTADDSLGAEIEYRVVPEKEITADDSRSRAQCIKVTSDRLGIPADRLTATAIPEGLRVCAMDDFIVKAGHRAQDVRGVIFLKSKVVDFSCSASYETREDRAIFAEMWLQTYLLGSLPTNVPIQRPPMPTIVASPDTTPPILTPD